jgi:hypothetical protein
MQKIAATNRAKLGTSPRTNRRKPPVKDGRRLGPKRTWTSLNWTSKKRLALAGMTPKNFMCLQELTLPHSYQLYGRFGENLPKFFVGREKDNDFINC